MTIAGSAQAQWNYVVDAIRADSTAMLQRVKVKDKNYPYKPGDTVGWLRNGDTVVIAKADSGFSTSDRDYVTVTVKGKKYMVACRDLKYGSNAEEKTDWVNSRESDRNQHTVVGHYYIGGTIPYWVLLALLLVAVGLAAIGREWTLLVIPLLLLAATAIEAYGFYLFRSDMLWWLDKANFGFWRRMLHLLLFVVAVAAQLGSMFLLRDRLTDGYGDLSVWRPVLFLLAAIVAVVISSFVCSLLHASDTLYYTIDIVLFVGILAVGLIGAFQDNIDELGGLWGSLFTVFTLVWGIGAVLAIALLVVGIFKVLLTLVLIALAIFVLYAIGSGSSSSAGSSSSSASSETPKYYDVYGNAHSHKGETEAFNNMVKQQQEEHRKKYGW